MSSETTRSLAFRVFTENERNLRAAVSGGELPRDKIAAVSQTAAGLLRSAGRLTFDSFTARDFAPGASGAV